MAEIRPIGRTAIPAGFVLGHKLDSIPFSAYHVMVIAVLALVGFVDLSMTGLLLVQAKGPLHLTGAEVGWLVAGPTSMLCVGPTSMLHVSAASWLRQCPITGAERR